MIAHEGSIITYFLTAIQKMSLPNSRWSHTAAAHMHESDMFELVDTGNQQQSNKEVDRVPVWKSIALAAQKVVGSIPREQTY